MDAIRLEHVDFEMFIVYGGCETEFIFDINLYWPNHVEEVSVSKLSVAKQDLNVSVFTIITLMQCKSFFKLIFKVCKYTWVGMLLSNKSLGYGTLEDKNIGTQY